MRLVADVDRDDEEDAACAGLLDLLVSRDVVVPVDAEGDLGA